MAQYRNLQGRADELVIKTIRELQEHVNSLRGKFEAAIVSQVPNSTAATASPPPTLLEQGLNLTLNAPMQITSGRGSPEGVILGSIGDWFLRQQDGIPGAAVYVKESGQSTRTGWTAIATSGGGGLVTSVHGRTGAVVAAVNDYTWAQINKTTSSIADIATRSAADLSSGILLAARMPALTGDVTTSVGAVATTIANDVVTYAKIQNVSVTARLLGRATAGAGDIEEIVLGTNLSFTGTTLNAASSSGATTALDNLASVAINAALVLATSDAFALGSATKMWSDLFLASGGVVNFDNGNVALTHSSNYLALSGSALSGFTIGANAAPNAMLDVRGNVTITGKLGIGIAPSTYDLTISKAGDVISQTTSTTATTGSAIMQSAVGSTSVDFRAYGSTGVGTLLGIASASANFLLAQGALAIGTYNNNPLTLSTNNTAAMTISTAQAIRFHAYGVGALSTDASGNITASDARLKNVLGPLRTGLAEVLKLNPIRYQWREDSGFDRDAENKLRGTIHAGFIAQEVGALIPESLGHGVGGFYNYDDRSLIGALVNAIKELSGTVTDLQKRKN